MTDEPTIDERSAARRADLLAALERRQAIVDQAQAEYDTAHEKSNKAWRLSQSKYQALDSAKELRDKALAELQAALPEPDPEPEMYPVEVR